MKSYSEGEFRFRMIPAQNEDQQSERNEVQRSASTQHERFDQDFFYIYLNFLSLSRFYKKHYIVVIKKVRIWECWGVTQLPIHEI